MFEIAIFGINGLISIAPLNSVWFREERIQFLPRVRSSGEALELIGSRMIAYVCSRVESATIGPARRVDGGVEPACPFLSCAP